MPPDVRAAVDYILSLESRREYSSEEIRRKAESRFGSDAAEQALAYSVSKGYVSDGRFAKAFVGSRIAALYGRIRIVSDLRNRGIDSGLAEDVLAELAPDWRAMAREAFRPNHMGLSVVRLASVDWTAKGGPVLYVTGADMVDGTPIFDIKPYVPYSDSHPEARGGFTTRLADRTLRVDFPEACRSPRLHPLAQEGHLALRFTMCYGQFG